MGNLKLELSYKNLRGESIYRIVYKETSVVPIPLTTLKGMKEFRDNLTEAIKEIENEIENGKSK